MAQHMDRETRLDIIRRAYAKRVLAAAGVSDRRVESVFASVKREDFLGPGPWLILRWGRGYEKSPAVTRSISMTMCWSASSPSAISTTASPGCMPC
jgi:protein-L-isoaspartate O-methyltransferase